MLSQLIDQFLLPAWFWVVAVAVFGAIIGSFLNVVIYRLHTGRSVNGRSHCLSCGKGLGAWELVPVVSYLMLRGRCSGCKCCVTSRYIIVEMLTAILFVLALFSAGSIIELLLLFCLMILFVVIGVYDFYHYIIPDELTAGVAVVVGGVLGWQWWTGALSSTEVFWTVCAGVLGACFYLLLWAVSKGRWLGFGDVKLAVPLGWLVGPNLVFSFVVCSFWIGAVVSVTILAVVWMRGKLRFGDAVPSTINTVIPFAPFLLVSALVVHLLSINVFTFFA